MHASQQKRKAQDDSHVLRTKIKQVDKFKYIGSVMTDELKC